jgi:hypothetical protein
MATNERYARSGADSTEIAHRLMLFILDAIGGDERWIALEELLTKPETAAVGEAVLVELFRDAGLWEDGEYVGPAKTGKSAGSKYRWAPPKSATASSQILA